MIFTSSCLYLSLSVLICRLYDCKMFDGGEFCSVFVLLGVRGGCWLTGSVDDTVKRIQYNGSILLHNLIKIWFRLRILTETYNIPCLLAANWFSWLSYRDSWTNHVLTVLVPMSRVLVGTNHLGTVHSESKSNWISIVLRK